MKIGVFDSGHGGTTVMESIKAILPDEDYFYIADSKNCPYGEKSDDELYEIVKANVEKLKDWGAKIIVIACNTATVRCINKLRAEYRELVFVGVEPAVKVALGSGAKNVLVLATPGTIKSERMRTLVKENRLDGQSIKLLACPGLADTIERNFKNGKIDDSKGEIRAKLHDLLSGEKKNYDAVSLGCTHYILVSDLIKEYFPGARLIDGNMGVAKRVKSLLTD